MEFLRVVAYLFVVSGLRVVGEETEGLRRSQLRYQAAASSEVASGANLTSGALRVVRRRTKVVLRRRHREVSTSRVRLPPHVTTHRDYHIRPGRSKVAELAAQLLQRRAAEKQGRSQRSVGLGETAKGTSIDDWDNEEGDADDEEEELQPPPGAHLAYSSQQLSAKSELEGARQHKEVAAHEIREKIEDIVRSRVQAEKLLEYLRKGSPGLERATSRRSALLAAQTHSQTLGDMLGSMWIDMRELGRPLYEDRLERHIRQLREREEKLWAEAETAASKKEHPADAAA